MNTVTFMEKIQEESNEKIVLAPMMFGRDPEKVQVILFKDFSQLYKFLIFHF